jgi:hypothetical protein
MQEAPEPTMGFEPEVPPSPFDSPAMGAQQSRKSVLNSLGGMLSRGLSTKSSAKGNTAAPSSSNSGAGAVAPSGASMRGRQISSLRPIVDVDEAEGSLAEMQSAARKNAEVQAIERELEQANTTLSSLNDAKVSFLSFPFPSLTYFLMSTFVIIWVHHHSPFSLHTHHVCRTR